MNCIHKRKMRGRRDGDETRTSEQMKSEAIQEARGTSIPFRGHEEREILELFFLSVGERICSVEEQRE